MVSKTGDIPDKDDVRPKSFDRISFLEELLDVRGEAWVYLSGSNPSTDDPDYKLHAYDTYVFVDDVGRGIVYTQNDEENECWFFTDSIISFEQH